MCAHLNLSLLRSCETRLQVQRSETSKEGLKELAALLFTEGRVEGKGEIIGHSQQNKRFPHVESYLMQEKKNQFVYHINILI